MGRLSLSCRHRRDRSCWTSGGDMGAVEMSSLATKRLMVYLSWMGLVYRENEGSLGGFMSIETEILVFSQSWVAGIY